MPAEPIGDSAIDTEPTVTEQPVPQTGEGDASQTENTSDIKNTNDVPIINDDISAVSKVDVVPSESSLIGDESPGDSNVVATEDSKREEAAEVKETQDAEKVGGHDGTEEVPSTSAADTVESGTDAAADGEAVVNENKENIPTISGICDPVNFNSNENVPVDTHVDVVKTDNVKDISHTDNGE